ncbi:LEA type 2 family protein [Bdellovibrio sp. NC01]|uniref:LEA type 2 family protein n=1 Tax=Bdellovibrio sp. NC01 TaxID=2220073 RepID=UPI00115A806E|nr:LEA type 2 family protein [Bdellovibrio sp. NC01]QDK37896.1 hypothetical protein DOE51_10030 [Bdellovibrio sp. NC01]
MVSRSSSKYLIATSLLLLMVISMTLSSCAFFKERYGQKPEVKLAQVYLQDANFQAATLVFVLDVKNPNKADLKIDQVDYEIQLDGQSFAKTTIDKQIILKSEATTAVEVPMPFEYMRLAGGLIKALKGEDVAYVFAGKAKVSGFTVPFNEKGTFNIKSLQEKHTK